jgi:hypothetical protein
MNKYDRLEELTKQRKLHLAQKDRVQKVWDMSAEEMSLAGADLLEIEDKIRSIEMQIDVATLAAPIVLGSFWTNHPIPNPSYWYQGALNNL